MFINAVLDKFSLGEFRKLSQVQHHKRLWGFCHQTSLASTDSKTVLLYMYTQIFYIVAIMQKPYRLII